MRWFVRDRLFMYIVSVTLSPSQKSFAGNEKPLYPLGKLSHLTLLFILVLR